MLSFLTAGDMARACGEEGLQPAVEPPKLSGPEHSLRDIEDDEFLLADVCAQEVHEIACLDADLYVTLGAARAPEGMTQVGQHLAQVRMLVVQGA